MRSRSIAQRLMLSHFGKRLTAKTHLGADGTSLNVNLDSKLVEEREVSFGLAL
jgi:hypothetical protein